MKDNAASNAVANSEAPHLEDTRRARTNLVLLVVAGAALFVLSTWTQYLSEPPAGHPRTLTQSFLLNVSRVSIGIAVAIVLTVFSQGCISDRFFHGIRTFSRTRAF